MLKHQPWLRYGRSIRDEFEQCEREGRDVEKFRSAVDAFCSLDDDTLLKNEEMIVSLAKAMTDCPVKPDFPYSEPSELNEILLKSPSNSAKPNMGEIPEGEKLREKLSGAWIGRIAGCLLGKPVEGWRRNLMYPVLEATDNYPMKKYIRQCEFSDSLAEKYRLNRGACFADNVKYASPVDDDTNYTVFALKLLSVYGRDFTSQDVLEGWLSWIPCLSTCTAERAAYRNAAMGLLPPETATYNNPYREWIGAQIRGDFFGYVNPGNPEKAAEMAFRDASISHVKNGIYGEMFISAMIAAAACTDDIREIIETGLAYVPVKSRLTEDIRFVISLYDSGKTAEEIIEEIHKKYNENSACDWCYTNSNAMIVAMALLCGCGDFGKSICLAVQSCFDTDCNGATVGSIIGMRNGESGIDPYWYAPFEKRLYTTIEGYNLVDIDFLVDATLKLM